MKKTSSISNRSIDSAGITKDYKEAIAELIWNGFDAKASLVDIIFDCNEIGHINFIKVMDNGEGIKYKSLSETFGFFLDSEKKHTYHRSSYVRGKKGKGRYSFATLSNKATWQTSFAENGKTLSYDIIIHKNTKHEYESLNPTASTNKPTGTCVVLEELYGVSGNHLNSIEFTEFLGREFGWFLFLNASSKYSLCLNGRPLDYSWLIEDSESRDLVIDRNASEQVKFAVTYVRWKEKIGDKYYYYYLDSIKIERGKLLTSYNNKAMDFHHSVFVESVFFDGFSIGSDLGMNVLFNECSSSPVFKKLGRELDKFLQSKQRDFVRQKGANSLVEKFEKKGVLPSFRDNKYDQARKNDLINVVKELYCVQPKIFNNLKKEQQITFLGFLNLILDSEERENILSIVESVSNISREERQELAGVLKRASLAKITETVKLIEERFSVVELLKALVFDLTKFTTERDHIQKVIEENYWLFGEQFHLVTADRHFEELLSKYLYIVDGVKSKQSIESFDARRRPDIFACRQRVLPDHLDATLSMEENIMIELKRPSVKITKTEFRQIDDYLDFILKESRFNSQLRRWKFYVISNEVDDYILKQYDAFKDKGKRFLVQSAGRYEIFALTWDDLFRIFEVHHSYLLEKIEFDSAAIREELSINGIEFNKTTADKVANQIISMRKI